jgi:hypothetical protein
LNGVTNISDSAWELGKMYSAPRDSIGDLVSRADCKKYGVYLLLSEKYVYVGQAIDLERRTKQHLTDKDWWTQVVLMTTKDDSFNASDIDYLESRLIGLAGTAATFDSDNKKRGNPQKVDEFRQAELEQYLDEALFLLELIGVRVFKSEKRKSTKLPGAAVSISQPKNTEQTNSQYLGRPALPDASLKIGQFVYTALRNLSNSGYVFSDSDIDEMCSPEWAKKTFHTTKPFMKKYISGVTDNKGSDGFVRFKSEPFTFGEKQVLVTKEWYERQRTFFINWYNSLG